MNWRTGCGGVATVLALLLVGATGADGPWWGVGRHDRSPEAYLSIGADTRFAAVGSVVWEGVSPSSAVLVHPRYVLTSRHQWYEGDSLRSPEQVTITLGDSAYRAVELLFHDSEDIALARLDRHVLKTTPPRRSTTHPLRLLGSVAYFVGYGATGLAFGETTAPGTKWGGTNVIDLVNYDEPVSQLWYDFDSPDSPALNRLGAVEPTDTEYYPLGGDSGGGIFVLDSIGPVLVGVQAGTFFPFPHANPREYSYYGSYAYDLAIHGLNQWIDSLINR